MALYDVRDLAAVRGDGDVGVGSALLAGDIQAALSPASWHAAGDAGIFPQDGVLVIRNAAAVHDDVRDYLSALRASTAASTSR